MFLKIIRILCLSSQRLLCVEDLPELCRIAPICRKYCAIGCVLWCVLALLIVLGYRVAPSDLIPKLMLELFVLFVLSGILAARFGRLCSAEKNPEYMAQITNMAEQHIECKRYLKQIRKQNRPLTHLDFQHMSKLYLYSKS